jgi:hypothetical protein
MLLLGSEFAAGRDSGVIVSIAPRNSLTCGGIREAAPATQAVSEVCRALLGRLSVTVRDARAAHAG